MPTCRNCHHPVHRADCGVDDCGCIRFEPHPPRQPRARTWVVSVAFFEKNRWMPDVELRVQAATVGGASLKALREARRQRASRRRVLQTRVTLVPVPRPGSRS